MKIREMRNQDLKELAMLTAADPLFSQYGMTESTARKTFRGALKNKDASVKVAIIQGEIAGFAYFVKRASFMRSGYLRLIGVSIRFQGRGIGKRLMRAMEAEIQGPQGIFLLVTQSNRKARKFYESLGYRKVGVLCGYIRTGINECIYFRAR